MLEARMNSLSPILSFKIFCCLFCCSENLAKILPKFYDFVDEPMRDQPLFEANLNFVFLVLFTFQMNQMYIGTGHRVPGPPYMSVLGLLEDLPVDPHSKVCAESFEGANLVIFIQFHISAIHDTATQ